ncbi:MAG: class I SAM-dependent methyltransferase [Prevotellaceae bacterium]|nr:class I SAM-dependent methyltransferase [Prevotellaceae bacterium]
MTLDDYILQHIDPEGDYLHALYRATNLRLLYPHMVSGHLQGRILKMLVALTQPRRVLEIGTYSGYSALCMAEGLTGDGHLYTFEINDEQEAFTRGWIDGSPHAHRITFRIGDALALAPALGETFDLVFIDGDKRSYIDYYEMAMRLTTERGVLVADNTLWDGHVVDPEAHDAQTRGIRAFNDHVAADPRVEKVILPLRDGLTVIRKK